MPAMIYTVNTTAAVALTGTVARTILGAADGALEYPPNLGGISIAFDGVTASAVPVLVEVCACTFATNPPGTNSTSRTPQQAGGSAQTPGWIAASAWTVEPTVITVVKEYLVSPNGGNLRDWFRDGILFSLTGLDGVALRCTAPANVNVRATMTFVRM